MPLWTLGASIVLTGMTSMFFSYVYFLLLNFSRTKLIELSNGNTGKTKAKKFLGHYNRILHAVVLVEIVVKILFILCLYLFINQHFELSPLYALLPAFIISGVWFVLFCRILPAEFGSHEEERALLFLIPFLDKLSILIYPLIYPLHLFAAAARKLTRGYLPEHKAEHFAEEIMDAVEEGEREGVIRETEGEMIESIVAMRTHEVSAIMTPRMDMHCVNVKTSVTEAVGLAIRVGHSRIPVYSENLERVVGVLYVKDLLEYWRSDNDDIPPITDIQRKPFFIPETKKISRLFQEFRENKVHMAIVLDEYGGTAGLVTNEDILEEIVGEIVDEYDKDEEQELRVLGENQAEMSAKLRIDELNEEMETDLPESEDYDTIGGFLFSHMGKVPCIGESYRFNNVIFTVIDSNVKRVKRIAIEITKQDEKKQKENGNAK